MALGARIAHWLVKRDMSQADLAKAVGVTTSAVSLWVSCKSSPSQGNLSKIVETFALTMAEFYGPLSTETAA